MSYRMHCVCLLLLLGSVLACSSKKTEEGSKTRANAETTAEASEETPEPAEKSEEAEKKAKVGEEEAPGLEPGAPTEKQAAGLDGEYVNAHSIMIDVDTEEMAEVKDCFSIWTFEDDSIEFGLELNFDFDHSCTMRGEAQPKGKGTWVYEGSKDTDDEGCELEILISEKHIDLKDTSGACREVWCGARGMIDSNRFDIKSRKPDSKKCGR